MIHYETKKYLFMKIIFFRPAEETLGNADFWKIQANKIWTEKSFRMPKKHKISKPSTTGLEIRLWEATKPAAVFRKDSSSENRDRFRTP